MNMLSAARNTANILGCPYQDCPQGVLCYLACRAKKAFKSEADLRAEEGAKFRGACEQEVETK
jgi:hypothetical protein